MKVKVALTSAEHRMLKKGDRVLVALSGGTDSVVLLHILLYMRKEWGLTLGALHLNHQLRGEESKRDEGFVRQLCEGWGIPLIVEHANVKEAAKQAGESIELAARRLRYDFFEREAERQGAKVATAHTATDNAETVLINLIRGTALRGLGGIPPVRGRFIRPLIDCTREEVEAYGREHSLAWVEDSTNQSNEHTRNRIRHQVLPLLKKENPRIIEGLARLTDKLRDDADYLDAGAAHFRGRIAREDGSYDRAEFLQTYPALRGRVLAAILREAGISPESELIERLGAAIAAGQGSWQLSVQVVFSSGEDAFRLKPPIELPAPEHFSHNVCLSDLERAPVMVEVFRGKRVTFSLQSANLEKKMPNVQKKDLTYCLDYDRIEKVVNLRPRQPGDKLRQPERGCTKTLKNLFQEAGVPPKERARAIVLADKQGVLWVEGLGSDERVAAGEGTQRTIEITVEGE